MRGRRVLASWGMRLWILMFALWSVAMAARAEDRKFRLLVLGDSIATGHGVGFEASFPARLQEMVDAAGLPFEVVNAGVSGDTTAGGLRRLNWLLKRPADVLLIELGGNDGLRGLPVEATRSNLVAIIREARRKNPEGRIILSGMQMPPNMGEEYTQAFRTVFEDVAGQEKVPLVPHLLEGVGGRPEMNLPDLIHPTAEGHRVIATNVWTAIEPVLREVARK